MWWGHFLTSLFLSVWALSWDLLPSSQNVNSNPLPHPLGSLAPSPCGNILSGLCVQTVGAACLGSLLTWVGSAFWQRGTSSPCLLLNQNVKHPFSQSRRRGFFFLYVQAYLLLTKPSEEIRGKGLNLRPNYLDRAGLENVVRGMCLPWCFYMLAARFASSDHTCRFVSSCLTLSEFSHPTSHQPVLLPFLPFCCFIFKIIQRNTPLPINLSVYQTLNTCNIQGTVLEGPGWYITQPSIWLAVPHITNSQRRAIRTQVILNCSLIKAFYMIYISLGVFGHVLRLVDLKFTWVLAVSLATGLGGHSVAVPVSFLSSCVFVSLSSFLYLFPVLLCHSRNGSFLK